MRAAFLLSPIILGALMVPHQSVPAAGQDEGRLVYVGTYTNANSLGIYAFRFDPGRGTLLPLGLAATTPNPSFLAASADGRFLFAVNELDLYEGARSGSVTSFAVDARSGGLKQLSVQASRGADPCHLALDRAGKFLAVANYSSGNVAVLPVRGDGTLGEAVSVVQHEGRGADARRQQGPHAHQVLFSADNRFLIVADLGLDRLLVYRFGASNGSLERNDPPGVALAPGSGPRHVAFHPNGTRAFVINELTSTVTGLEWNAGAGVFSAGSSVSTVPAGFDGRNSTAEIAVHPGGRFVYGSNRGHDSISLFAADAGGGLSLVEAEPSGGRSPRHFTITSDGRWLLAANQASGNLAVFRIDRDTGRLTPEGEPAGAGTPVCVLFPLPD